MFELIWILLNIAIFIYFLFICFEVLKYIKNKIGILKTVILTIGLISIISQNSSNEYNFIDLSNKSNTYTEKFKIDELIENKIISKINLSIFYIKKDNEIKFTDVKTEKLGIIGGTELEIHSIAINKTEISKQYNYRLYASKIWKILGFRIYTESKEYDGEFIIK
ncbi:hypothetical protein [Empedobacter sp. UBA6322]|uniref:hypothetical protein n=1 Tax=Empedobacter sp. UBA6322 TaxID=1946446 RepID=UPI0025BE5CDA|nr:hypothetical protein [Empedobacter sp. UBA6322]